MTSLANAPATSLPHYSGGYGYGIIGVLIFSLTLPMSHLAVAEINPLLIGLGRAWIAAIPAGLILWLSRSRRPTRAEWRGIALAAVGVVAAWPIFSTIAMLSVPASHGAVFNGLLPLTTALFGAWRSHERLARSFWLWACVGAALVTGFALYAGHGSLQAGDLWLIAAVIFGGMGYAEGGRVSRTLGGWRTICWCLIGSLPFISLPTFYLAAHISHWPSPAVLGAFAYLAFGSMFLGFFAWYKGLAIGGIARVGQVQLIQPFLTVLASAWLFSEKVAPVTYLFAVLIVIVIAASRYATRRPGQ
ncbi:DMT family transporter [Paralcaligenes ginsengisoli]